MEIFILFGLFSAALLMMAAKRLSALIRGFRWQSFFVFCATFYAAFHEKHMALYVVSALLLMLKVFLIPHLLEKIATKIKVNENLGLFINPQLSIVCALVLTYFSWTFSRLFVAAVVPLEVASLTLALSSILFGGFLMIFRAKALAQIVGLLVMENGIFLLAAAVIGGMPFFTEIAIFFDVFVSVLILGAFVYRINRLFTHIDVNKLSRLRG
jgi:hydrogenase-4 component E